MKDFEHWRKVGPFNGVIYAEMIGEVLQNQKIPYFVSQDWYSAAYGIKGASVMGENVFLFVPQDFYEQAIGIVETIFSEDDE